MLLFGADPTGRRDSRRRVRQGDRVRAEGAPDGLRPAGHYQVNRHIVVDNVTIEGAGSWYTIIKGHEVALSTPAPDGSVHTGVGFYGKYAADGGSPNVHLSGFAIEGDVRERIDTDQVNGIGGALSNSTIDGLYIHHTKVGHVARRPDDEPARSPTTSSSTRSPTASTSTPASPTPSSRTTSSATPATTALAMWSEKTANASNTFDHNTVQTPMLANGIAIYGGTDNTVSNNLVADPIREGSGIQVGSRFGAEPFTGHLWITDNTTVRAGTYELNWNIGLGAIWFYALEKNIDADIQVVGRPLPRQHLQRDHAGHRLAGEGPVLDHERALQGHPGGRHRHLGGQRPGGRVGRRSRTWTPATSAPSASTTAARSTSPPPARSSR